MCDNCERIDGLIKEIMAEQDMDKKEKMIEDLEKNEGVQVIRDQNEIGSILGDRMGRAFFDGMSLVNQAMSAILYDMDTPTDQKVIVLQYLTRQFDITIQKGTVDLHSREEARDAMHGVQDLGDLLAAMAAAGVRPEPETEDVPDIDIRQDEKPRGIRYEDTDDGQIN